MNFQRKLRQLCRPLLPRLHQLLPRRPDLKVIITSATIDPQRFSRHFSDAPIIEVSGRTYAVETRYRPLISEDPDEEDRAMIQAWAEHVYHPIQCQRIFIHGISSQYFAIIPEDEVDVDTPTVDQCQGVRIVAQNRGESHEAN